MYASNLDFGVLSEFNKETREGKRTHTGPVLAALAVSVAMGDALFAPRGSLEIGFALRPTFATAFSSAAVQRTLDDSGNFATRSTAIAGPLQSPKRPKLQIALAPAIPTQLARKIDLATTEKAIISEDAPSNRESKADRRSYLRDSAKHSSVYMALDTPEPPHARDAGSQNRIAADYPSQRSDGDTPGQRFKEALDEMYKPVSIVGGLDTGSVDVTIKPEQASDDGTQQVAQGASIADAGLMSNKVESASIANPADFESVIAQAKVQPISDHSQVSYQAAATPPLGEDTITNPDSGTVNLSELSPGFTVALLVNGKSRGEVALFMSGFDSAQPARPGTRILIKLADIISSIRPLMDEATFERLIGHHQTQNYVALFQLRDCGIATFFDSHDRLHLRVRTVSRDNRSAVL